MSGAVLSVGRAGGSDSHRQALTVVEWHLGLHHPVLADMYLEFADALLVTGDALAGAQHITVARDLCATVLGPSHTRVGLLSLRLAYVTRVRDAVCA